MDSLIDGRIDSLMARPVESPGASFTDALTGPLVDLQIGSMVARFTQSLNDCD